MIIWDSLPFVLRTVRHKMDSLSTATVEFCLDVFKELNSNNVGDNIFFSPLSMLYALSMILLGARGNSAEQMGKVWNAPKMSPQPRSLTCALSESAELLTSLYQENSAILWKKNACWAKYFLKIDNGLNNAIHYDENYIIHAIHSVFLTTSGFTHTFPQFTFRVHLFSDLNLTESPCTLLALWKFNLQ